MGQGASRMALGGADLALGLGPARTWPPYPNVALGFPLLCTMLYQRLGIGLASVVIGPPIPLVAANCFARFWVFQNHAGLAAPGKEQGKGQGKAQHRCIVRPLVN